MRRIATALLLCMLAAGLSSATIAATTAPADAIDNCVLVLEPFVANDGGFAPTLNQPTVTGAQILAFFNGDTARVVSDANQVLRNPALSPAIRTFYTEILAWANFLNSNTCAKAVAYPGPFENMPPSPTSPYGFDMNPASEFDISRVLASPSGPAAVAASGPALAHTGSEAGVLAFIGLGLIAFGSAALGTRRRLS